MSGVRTQRFLMNLSEILINKLRRKADQHWEMAGLARQDNDQADAERHTLEARRLEKALGELRRSQEV